MFKLFLQAHTNFTFANSPLNREKRDMFIIKKKLNIKGDFGNFSQVYTTESQKCIE